MPLRIEIGPRDISSNSVMISRRDENPKDKHSITIEEVVEYCKTTLPEMQKNIFQKAKDFREQNTVKNKIS